MGPGRNHGVSLATTAVVIPALNEAKNLKLLLPQLSRMRIGQIIVADNGSTDGTADVAACLGACVVTEPRRGYGAACFAGMQHLADSIDVVTFLDADLADDHTLLPRLVGPILVDRADLVIAARVAHLRAPGSMTAAQRFGNWLATGLIRLGWRHRYRDLGPFRAVRRSCLEKIGIKDRAFGWTIEMQIRAVEEGLRCAEVEAPYRARLGRSKISGTLKGAALAGYWILATCGYLYFTRGKRTLADESPTIEA